MTSFASEEDLAAQLKSWNELYTAYARSLWGANVNSLRILANCDKADLQQALASAVGQPVTFQHQAHAADIIQCATAAAGASTSRAVAGGAAGADAVGGGAGPGTSRPCAAPPGAVGDVVLPPRNAVLPLRELKRDGSAETVGTLVVASPDGLCFTALHCVNFDGCVYPEALTAGGCGIKFVAALTALDVAVLELQHQPGPSSSAAELGTAGGGNGGSGSGRSSGGGASASSGDKSSAAWPCVRPSASLHSGGALRSGAPVTVLGFPQCAEQGHLLQDDQPLVCHGIVSHHAPTGSPVIADYTAFRNCSGGAVVASADGSLLGIHIAELTHSGSDEEDEDEAQAPKVMSGRPPAAGQQQQEEEEEEEEEEQQQRSSKKKKKKKKKGGGGQEGQGIQAKQQQQEQQIQRLSQQLGALEVKLGSKGTVGLFVPCTAILEHMLRQKLLPPTFTERWLATAATRKRRRG